MATRDVELAMLEQGGRLILSLWVPHLLSCVYSDDWLHRLYGELVVLRRRRRKLYSASPAVETKQNETTAECRPRRRFVGVSSSRSFSFRAHIGACIGDIVKSSTVCYYQPKSRHAGFPRQNPCDKMYSTVWVNHN